MGFVLSPAKEAEFLDGSTTALCGENGDFHFQK
jgi:hypothetical protein